MVSQQKAKKAQGRGNSIDRVQATPSAPVAQVEVRSDEVETVGQSREGIPTKLSVPDDTVGSLNTPDAISMNEIEVSESGEIVPATEGRESAASSTKRRRKKKYREVFVDASEVMPRPSVWPIVLAFSIAVVLFGFIWNAIVLFIGVALIIVSIIGWSLEKRDRTYKTAVPVKSGTKSASMESRESNSTN